MSAVAPEADIAISDFRWGVKRTLPAVVRMSQIDPKPTFRLDGLSVRPPLQSRLSATSGIGQGLGVARHSSAMAIRSISIRKSGSDSRVTPTIVDGGGFSGLPNFGVLGWLLTFKYSSTSSTKMRR